MLRRALQLNAWALATTLVVSSVGCHRHKHAPPDFTASQEPDRVLFEKSLEDIKNHRYAVARLTLQTLLNTYPDSDSLDRAKLAIADSWYEEGGTAGLTHAEAEYKDFITFFPNSPHAAYAQHRAAMCHYRQLEKPDRDRTHASRAERDFQLLLISYPESEYAADGAIKLKEVQEVLAEAEYRVGRFYYIKQAYVAAASRLEDLAAKYPNYSQLDDALWMVGQSFEKMEIPNRERAALYYARILTDFPLSGRVDNAQKRLQELGKPIPQPSPEVLARAQKEAELMEERGRSLLGRLFGMFSGKPDTSPAWGKLGPPVLDTDSRKPPPITEEEIEAQRQILVARLAANNPHVAKEGEENKGGNANKKGFWRKLVPFW